MAFSHGTPGGVGCFYESGESGACICTPACSSTHWGSYNKGLVLSVSQCRSTNKRGRVSWPDLVLARLTMPITSSVSVARVCPWAKKSDEHFCGSTNNRRAHDMPQSCAHGLEIDHARTYLTYRMYDLPESRYTFRRTTCSGRAEIWGADCKQSIDVSNQNQSST